MDQNRFARITLTLTAIPTRRDVVRGLAAAGVGLGLAQVSWEAEARKRRKKKPKKPQVKRNTFGCVDVGKFCKNASQCCSGICQGKKGKKQCRAHNVSTCTAADDSCDGNIGNNVSCGTDGFCYRTTGKASFCGVGLGCRVCARDIDCEPEFGPGAACLVCEDCIDVTGSSNTFCSDPRA